MVPDWIEIICSNITKKLAILHKPFKYVGPSIPFTPKPFSQFE